MELTHSPLGRGDAGGPAHAWLARYAPGVAVGVGLITLVALQFSIGTDPAASSAAPETRPSAVQPTPRVDDTARPPLGLPALPPAAETVLPDHDRELLSYAPHGG